MSGVIMAAQVAGRVKPVTDGAPAIILFFRLFHHIPYSLVYVRIDGMVGLREVAPGEQRVARVFHIVQTDGIGENRQQVFDPQF